MHVLRFETVKLSIYYISPRNFTNLVCKNEQERKLIETVVVLLFHKNVQRHVKLRIYTYIKAKKRCK